METLVAAARWCTETPASLASVAAALVLGGILLRGRKKATVRHCVMGQLKDDATEEQKQAMVKAMRAMAADIPQIQTLYAGLDLGLADGNHSFCATVDFLTEEDYKIYAKHPAHVKVITECIKPLLKPGSRTAVQFSLKSSL